MPTLTLSDSATAASVAKAVLATTSNVVVVPRDSRQKTQVRMRVSFLDVRLVRLAAVCRRELGSVPLSVWRGRRSGMRVQL